MCRGLGQEVYTPLCSSTPSIPKETQFLIRQRGAIVPGSRKKSTAFKLSLALQDICSSSDGRSRASSPAPVPPRSTWFLRWRGNTLQFRQAKVGRPRIFFLEFELPLAHSASACRRIAFSWDMTRIVRNGLPGLWDHDMTGKSCVQSTSLFSFISSLFAQPFCMSFLHVAHPVTRMTPQIR